MLALDSGAGHKARARSVHVEHVNQGERDVVPMRGQRPGGALASRLHRPRVGRGRAEVPQNTHPALPEHAPGLVAARTEHAANIPPIIGYRAVRVPEVCLLGIAVPLHDEGQLLGRDRLSLVEDQLQLGAQRVPNFSPDLPSWLPERPRVPPPEEGDVRIVVEIDELTPPPDEHGTRGTQDDLQRDLERVRPHFTRSDWGFRPVEGAHQCSNLATACKAVSAGELRMGIREMRHGRRMAISPRSLTDPIESIECALPGTIS
jgi:hypothetical protein